MYWLLFISIIVAVNLSLSALTAVEQWPMGYSYALWDIEVSSIYLSTYLHYAVSHTDRTFMLYKNNRIDRPWLFPEFFVLLFYYLLFYCSIVLVFLCLLLHFCYFHTSVNFLCLSYYGVGFMVHSSCVIVGWGEISRGVDISLDFHRVEEW